MVNTPPINVVCALLESSEPRRWVDVMLAIEDEERCFAVFDACKTRGRVKFSADGLIESVGSISWRDFMVAMREQVTRKNANVFEKRLMLRWGLLG